jgi:flagellar transcriptional activator FlhC
MCKTNMMQEYSDLQTAIELINLGARLQLLEKETSLSRAKLTKLYRELKGKSPPKGMLPFSADWYVTWENNIHATMFYNIYRIITEHYGSLGIGAIISSYRLYLEQCPSREQMENVLSLTRAWTLVRFCESRILQLTPCTQCKGDFITHGFEPYMAYQCVICYPPSRASRRKEI